MKTDNKKLNKIAQKVLDQIPNNDPERFGFVITILMIISITLTLIRILQECNKDTNKLLYSSQEKYAYYGEQIKTCSIKKTWFTKLTVRRIVRSQLGRDNYREHGAAVVDAVLNTGANLTEDEIITLVEAANV